MAAAGPRRHIGVSAGVNGSASADRNGASASVGGTPAASSTRNEFSLVLAD